MSVRARLPDGRWHFQHGPIDCVLSAEGDADAVGAAHEAAWTRFTTILDELVRELPLLRERVGETTTLSGEIARRMWRACRPYRDRFVTPMAAVAGSVADALVAPYRRPGVRRAWVNNGGDIALQLAPGASVRVGLYADLARFDHRAWQGAIDVDGRFTVAAATAVRGIATSGWRGRSFSLGIADSVTVLARTGAEADAAATMIANAVDVDDARIVRRPASSLKDDSDLGEHRVTVDVPPLGHALVEQALAAGLARADAFVASGLVEACVLTCQGRLVATRSPIDATRPASAWHAPRFSSLAMRAAA